jgi:probable rRNA maturation factor
MTLSIRTINPKALLARIQIRSRQRRYRVYRESVALFCAALLGSLGYPNHAVSIVFVGARMMRVLNRRYRQKDYPTDVLSFSYGEMKIDQIPFLGEVVISPEIAVRQAIHWGVSPERELRKLLVHGILHLLGYDHETDEGQMNYVQTKLLRRKFFADAPSLADLKGNRGSASISNGRSRGKSANSR